MSSWNLDPEDWFRGFFGGSSSGNRGGIEPFSKLGSWFGNYMPRQLDEMRREMQSMFEE